MRGRHVLKTNRVLRGGAAAVRPASHYAALTPQRKRLVDEYLKDLNARQAALRAGYSPTRSTRCCARRRCSWRSRSAASRSTASGRSRAHRYVLNRLWDIATADPRELVEIWKVPCRYCWGIGGQYQFTKTEMHRLVKAHQLGHGRQAARSAVAARPAGEPPPG